MPYYTDSPLGAAAGAAGGFLLGATQQKDEAEKLAFQQAQLAEQTRAEQEKEKLDQQTYTQNEMLSTQRPKIAAALQAALANAQKLTDPKEQLKATQAAYAAASTALIGIGDSSGSMSLNRDWLDAYNTDMTNPRNQLYGAQAWNLTKGQFIKAKMGIDAAYANLQARFKDQTELEIMREQSRLNSQGIAQQFRRENMEYGADQRRQLAIMSINARLAGQAQAQDSRMLVEQYIQQAKAANTEFVQYQTNQRAAQAQTAMAGITGQPAPPSRRCRPMSCRHHRSSSSRRPGRTRHVLEMGPDGKVRPKQQQESSRLRKARRARSK